MNIVNITVRHDNLLFYFYTEYLQNITWIDMKLTKIKLLMIYEATGFTPLKNICILTFENNYIAQTLRCAFLVYLTRFQHKVSNNNFNHFNTGNFLKRHKVVCIINGNKEKNYIYELK